MRRYFLFACVFFGVAVYARSDDRPFLQRIAERTPMPCTPVEHSAARAGYPQSVHSHAQPSVTCRDYAGYIGGACLKGNNLRARGPESATGPLRDGVFGTDYAGVRANLGRLFLAPSYDPSRSGPPIYLAYLAEGPRLTDPIALRPIRNAVLAKREAAEERHGGGHGEGGHCESGHGEGGHAPEGGAPEPKGGN